MVVILLQVTRGCNSSSKHFYFLFKLTRSLGLMFPFHPQFVSLNYIFCTLQDITKNVLQHGAALLQNIIFRTNQCYFRDLYIMQNDIVSTCSLFRDITLAHFFHNRNSSETHTS